MPRIEPAKLDDLGPREQAAVSAAEDLLGFTANDALTLAKLPRVMHAVSGLVEAVYASAEAGATLDQGMRRLVALAASSAAGCQYCQAHVAHSALQFGINETQLAEIHNFEQSEAFSDDQRAAIRVAYAGGQSPSRVTDAMFRQLDRFFSEQQQLEIVSVIALFGFLNRWNATLATEIESRPARVMHDLLSGHSQSAS